MPCKRLFKKWPYRLDFAKAKTHWMKIGKTPFFTLWYIQNREFCYHEIHVTSNRYLAEKSTTFLLISFHRNSFWGMTTTVTITKVGSWLFSEVFKLRKVRGFIKNFINCWLFLGFLLELGKLLFLTKQKICRFSDFRPCN